MKKSFTYLLAGVSATALTLPAVAQDGDYFIGVLAAQSG